jgi:hypothetical protein
MAGFRKQHRDQPHGEPGCRPYRKLRQFVLDAVAPAGADTARVVYAIQTFGPEPTNTGTAFVDDASLVQTVPEPASVLLLGASLAWLAVAARLARLPRRGGNLYTA